VFSGFDQRGISAQKFRLPERQYVRQVALFHNARAAERRHQARRSTGVRVRAACNTAGAAPLHNAMASAIK
jgi:hypothetical protein